MTAEEVNAFEVEPFFRDALKLRRWDDTAKAPNAATPNLNEFLPYWESALNRS